MESTDNSTIISSQERINFARMCWIVVEVFRDILWYVLTREISSADLQSKVRTNQDKLEKLNKTIKEWLCAALPVSPGRTDFDATSLYQLIINLCNQVDIPTNGWHQDPPIAGRNIGDDIERVRVFRNHVYGHAMEARVNNVVFVYYCSHIKTFVTNFDKFFGVKHNFVERIESILRCSMDQALQDTYIEKMQEIARLSDVTEEIWKELGIAKGDIKSLDDKFVAEIEKSRKVEDELRMDLDAEKDDMAKVKQTIKFIKKGFGHHRRKSDAAFTKRRRQEISLKNKMDTIIEIIQKDKEEKSSYIDKREQKRIIASSQLTLNKHTSHADKHFVETQGYRKAYEILQQHRRLIITGKSGQGKSYMSYHLLKKIIAEYPNIKPLILTSVKQWTELVDSSNTLGVIVDDMCGNICLNEEELKKWTEEATYMPAVVENGKHVVIFTMKSLFCEKILLAMRSCPLFSKQIILNLDHTILQFEERIKFVNRYLKRFDLNEEEVSNLCKVHEAPVGFPQLCKASEMIDKKPRLLDLFSKPRELILSQIKYIQQNDKMIYCCLALVLLSKGQLYVHSIKEFEDDSKGNENIAISLFRSYRIPLVPVGVIKTLKSLQGTYLSFDETEDSYSFDHDSIEEAMFASHGFFFPEQTLRECSLQLICKRCTISYDSNILDTIKEDNTLTLQPTCQPILINRFITALKGGIPSDFTNVSEANVWSCKSFRKAFLSECKEIHFLADQNKNSLLVHAANINNSDLVDELLQELDHIDENKKTEVALILRKSAIASCAHNDTSLLKKICTKDHIDPNDILPNIIRHGSVVAIEFLLESGADINYRSKNGETLLHIACLYGRIDIVKLLHSQNADILKHLADHNQSVSLCVAAGASVEILEFLIPLGLNPFYTDPSGWNFLYYASLQGKKAMVEHIVKKYPKMLGTEANEGFSVLLCAAYGGNVCIFKTIYDVMENSLKANQNTDENVKNNITYLMQTTTYQQELLHMSCLGGGLEMTKYLIETYPKMLDELNNSKRTPAHYAAESGNISLLKYLFERGTDPRCRTSQKETLLHRACLKGQLKITKYLVKMYPTMLDEKDNNNRTPAHHAVESGNLDVLRYIIEGGADPKCINTDKETLLHRACIRGHLEMVKYLVEKYRGMLSEVDDSKNTPAHHAAESGNVAVLKYLIERNIDPFCKNSEEETLLHNACINGQLEMTKYLIENYPTMFDIVDDTESTAAHHAAESGNVAVLSYLIEHGTNPRSRTAEGETLLHKACINGHLEITTYLLTNYPEMIHDVDDSNSTPAHHAAEGGNVSLLRYLIDSGNNQWSRTSEKETLLHRACINGDFQMTKYLVEMYPSMLNEVDSSNRTPAHRAAESGIVAVLSYLTDRGIDTLCRTSKEETLIHRACAKGQLEMTKYLVEKYPAMLHEVDSSNRTPAHRAAESGTVDLLSYLIDLHSDPWCKTCKGETVLHRACTKAQLEMTKYLVDKYPTMIHEVDNSKRTPAHCTAENGNVSVLSYLLDHGADPWCKTSEEETLLHRAYNKGQSEIIKYLVERYPSMLQDVDNSKRTPDHCAAESGNVAF